MASSSTIAAVDDRGVVLTAAGSSPLVVHLDGRYMWSFTPDRDSRLARGDVIVGWPPALTPYLNGVAHVRVSEVAGPVRFEADVAFGEGLGAIDVADSRGMPLSVSKGGQLVQAFSERGDEQHGEILDGTLRLLADLRERCGIDPYLGFGALLGAVREGRILGHDSDIDLAYVSRHTSPAEVLLESFQIERGLTDLGWGVIRMGGNDLKAILPLTDGGRCHIDVFPSFFVDDVYYLMPNCSGALTWDDLVPFSTVTLLGRELPAPRRPEAMLEFLYGPGWRVPDPSFKFDNPPEGIRRINGWLRGAQYGAELWTAYWSSPEGKAVKDPSEFARWVHERIPTSDGILELGAGRGADAKYFARHGHPVVATDFASSALAHLRFLARNPTRSRLKQDALQVTGVRLGDRRHALWLGAKLAHEPRHLYARQLLGAMTPSGWEGLLIVASMALRGKSKLFLEFSMSGRFRPESPVFRTGMMRRIDGDQVCADIRAHGGTIEHRSVKRGIDAWGNPDPAVCRLVVSWRREAKI